MKQKEILYNPSLSVKANAKANGVSEASIRYYIKVNGIDRRADEKVRKIDICRKYYRYHSDANINQMAKDTKVSYFFIKKNWDYIKGEKVFDNFDKDKIKKRKSIKEQKYITPHISVIRDLLREVQFAENILTDSEDFGNVINKCGHIFGILSDNIKSKTCDIITIPSVNDDLKALLSDYLKRCKEKVAMLLPISFLTGSQRYKTIFSKLPLSEVWTYIENVNVQKKEDIEGSEPLSFDNYAWYIFERNYNGTPQLKWIHNDSTHIFYNEDTIETTILKGIIFKPNEWFKYAIADVIQFHSKALPENKVLSNHYDCIITFRGIEFYALEQLFLALTFSNSPSILDKIMRCNNGTKAKSVGKEIGYDKRDWDVKLKQYRLIALCHLYKYLSFKEYRERLRETRGKILVECPNGSDYHFACVQNLDTNILEGNNCSGRTTMIVRDMMLALEDEALNEARKKMGRDLSNDEREHVIQTVLDKVRDDFDSDPQVILDSEKVIDFIEKNNIPKIKNRKPVPPKEVMIDKSSKCLILDFDNTIFDTSIDAEFRKAKGKKNWKKIYSLIPQYKLYDGWKEVFEFAKENNIKIGIISAASSELIKRTIEHFRLPIEVIIGYQQYIEKPNPILGNMVMEKLNVREKQILYVGDSLDDDKQARSSMMKFVGAVWDSEYEEELREKCDVIENPREIIPLLQSLKIDN